MSEKYLIHSRLTKVNSLYVFGHEIVIGYIFFSNKLQITMAGAKKLSIHQERKGLAKYSYPSCKVILSSPPSKKKSKTRPATTARNFF